MKKYVTVLLSSLALMIFSGCSQPADTPLPPETKEESAQWRTEGFAAPQELVEEQSLWAGQYLLWEHKSQVSSAGAEAPSHLDCGVCGELFWHFSRNPDSEGEYVLEIYDTTTGESTVKRVSPKELGLKSTTGFLDGMDMLDGEHYVFQWVDYEQNEEGMYHRTEDKMVYTNLKGDIQTAALRQSYLEKGHIQDDFTASLLYINWHCDGKGNIYFINDKEYGCFEFYLVDRYGDILMEYEGTPKQQLVEPLRTSDGELIIPIYDNGEKYYEFLWANTVEGVFRPLVRMEANMPFIIQMYGMLGNDIYYRSREGTEEGIVKWNIETGSNVQVLGFRTSGISTDFQTMLALRDGQTPFLQLTKFKDGKPKEWLTELSEQEPADDGAIRVADLTIGGESKSQVAACAVLASTEFPDFRYEYDDASAQEDRDRILVELSQGKGPELLFVPLEDMYLLEEKGLLLDIGELLPSKLQEELLPGALELGTVNGRILGVPVAIQADTFAVAADTWSENTWKLEDVIDLMAEGKLTGAIRNCPHFMMGKYTNPSLTVLSLVKHSLADSFLIDWENRKSHFDDERFIQLLELTGTDMSGVPTNTDAWLNEGKDILWGYFCAEADFLDFFAHMEAEGGRIIGHPTESTCGSYLVADGGVLVVNANIAQKEAAACFLETLLGEELQSKATMMCMSVRKLVPENYIVEKESGKLTYMGGQPEVPVFQDGTTSLHRAKTFLESCVAAPPDYSQITTIIYEELSAMYAEQKSPKTTAEIINSRVQLYLDEGN